MVVLTQLLVRLKQLFARFRDTGVRFNLEKCKFGLTSVPYLGHIIDHDGLKTQKDKVKAIMDASEPTNIGELRSFL